MGIQPQISKGEQFRAFYIFFIISAMQLGVGMIGTPRIVFNAAGHDAWISILLAYLLLLLLVFVMLYILKQYKNMDIIAIQEDLFGKFISKVLGTVYILYFSAEILSILVTYIEIIRVFIFPDSSPFVLGCMLIILIIYSSIGGIRIIVGVAFIFLLLSHWIFFLLPVPMADMNFQHFLPVMDRSIGDIFKGTTATAYTFLGVEILFFFYPFIQNKKNIRLPIILGISWSTLVVLLTTVISIGYFSATQLERRVWPVLNLFKIQSSPFIERLDYVVVAEWMMMSIPHLILLMWGVTYAAKRMYKIPTTYSLYFVSGILLLAIPFFKNHFQIQYLIDGVRVLGIGVVYIYPFILLPLVVMKKQWQKRKKGVKTNANH